MKPWLQLPQPLAETRRLAGDAAVRLRIASALDASGWNWNAAARALRIDRTNLRHRARKVGLL